MFSGDISGLNKDANGKIFLDRDPKIFNLMLNYIRHEGNFSPNNVSLQEDKILFELELKHWGLGD